MFCSDGGMGHRILSLGTETDERRWRRRRWGRKLLDRGVLEAPAMTSEQQSSIMGRNNDPSLSLALFSVIS